MPLHERLAGRMAAFSLAGVANTIVGIALIVSCGMLGLGPVAANVIGYAGGLLLSFTLNSRVTFRNRSRDQHTVVRFLAAFAVAFALNLAIVALLTPRVPPSILASLAGTPAYMACFFILCEKWVFRSVPQPP